MTIEVAVIEAAIEKQQQKVQQAEQDLVTAHGDFHAEITRLTIATQASHHTYEEAKAEAESRKTKAEGAIEALSDLLGGDNGDGG